MPTNAGWVCTDHFDWDGETLHVAAHNDHACAAWLDKDRYWDSNHDSGRGRRHSDWASLRAHLEALPQFLIEPPTDEEVEAAAEALRKMVEEMS